MTAEEFQKEYQEFIDKIKAKGFEVINIIDIKPELKETVMKRELGVIGPIVDTYLTVNVAIQPLKKDPEIITDLSEAPTDLKKTKSKK